MGEHLQENSTRIISVEAKVVNEIYVDKMLQVFWSGKKTDKHKIGLKDWINIARIANAVQCHN